jgi:hypothetical protein
MSGRASQRGRFFGRRKPKTVRTEQVQQEEPIDPMRREDYWRWLELQSELETAKNTN